MLEKEATNTAANLTLSRALLERHGIHPKTAILVQKPYMERRTMATCVVAWPELNATITSPQISFEDYPNPEISFDEMVNIMVGDLQRLWVYAKKGWSKEQHIPDDVIAAYEKLVNKGYDKHLIEEK